VYHELQAHNRRATRLLMAGAVVLVAVMVWIAAGALGLPVLDPYVGVTITLVGTIVGVGLMLTSVRQGPKIALKAARARPVTRDQAPQLHNVFDEVCVSAGLHGDNKPTLYLVQDPAPNAFATGLKPDDAHVAVTTGLVEQLPRYELRAVLAHEVAHVVNDDIRAVTVAVATAGLVALLADVVARGLVFGGGRRRSSGGSNPLFLVLGIVAIVLAPVAAQMIRFAVSRQREYLADATAADMLRDPQSMVDALRRIDGNHTSLARAEVATAHMWFEEPNDIKGKGAAAKLARRFATHPTIADRVSRLASLNSGTVQIDRPLPQRPGPDLDGMPPPSMPPPMPQPGQGPFPPFPPTPGQPGN
jgi:heat shock protein HtpX